MIFKYHTMHQANCDLQHKNIERGIVRRFKVRKYYELGRQIDFDGMYYQVNTGGTLIVPEVTSTRLIFTRSLREAQLRPSSYFYIGKFIGNTVSNSSPNRRSSRRIRRLRPLYLINRAGNGASLNRKVSQWL